MPTREDFEMALALAQDAYRKQNPEVQAARAGAGWHPASEADASPGRAVLRFLGTDYEILSPAGDVRFRDQPGKEPALWEKTHLLHYVNTAGGRFLSHQPLSFKDIPDGRLYLPNFEKRVVSPLLARFGKRPEEVWEPAKTLGGSRAEPGDFSVTIPVFPRIPVTLVFWKEDEEFQARVSVLYDRTATSYLPTEDLVLTAQMLAFRLMALAGRVSRGRRGV